MHSEKHTHPQNTNLKSIAFMATAHCLTGCATGEVAGLLIGDVASLSNLATTILATILAFSFGYSFTMFPLLRSMSLKSALGLALASDTISIAVMEVVDNTVMYLIPGAMDASIFTQLYWFSTLVSLVCAFIFAYPANMFLISKGKGHAVIHKHH